MTEHETALRELLAKGTDASLLREMIGFATQRLMELEVGGMTGAANGERRPDLQVQRSGYRQRDWDASREAGRWPGAMPGRVRPSPQPDTPVDNGISSTSAEVTCILRTIVNAT
jgi:hypothetical protein